MAELRASNSGSTSTASRTTIAGPHSLLIDAWSAVEVEAVGRGVEGDDLAPGVDAGVGPARRR